ASPRHFEAISWQVFDRSTTYVTNREIGLPCSGCECSRYVVLHAAICSRLAGRILRARQFGKLNPEAHISDGSKALFLGANNLSACPQTDPRLFIVQRGKVHFQLDHDSQRQSIDGHYKHAKRADVACVAFATPRTTICTLPKERYGSLHLITFVLPQVHGLSPITSAQP